MFMKYIEKQLTAATYAQAGEPEEASGIINKKTNRKTEGGISMKQETARINKNRFIIPAVGFGIVSLSLYAALLINEGRVMDLFTRGGWHTVLPVGCAFLFSFIHGAFASNLLSSLGIEAKK